MRIYWSLSPESGQIENSVAPENYQEKNLQHPEKVFLQCHGHGIGF